MPRLDDVPGHNQSDAEAVEHSSAVALHAGPDTESKKKGQKHLVRVAIDGAGGD